MRAGAPWPQRGGKLLYLMVQLFSNLTKTNNKTATLSPFIPSIYSIFPSSFFPLLTRAANLPAPRQPYLHLWGKLRPKKDLTFEFKVGFLIIDWRERVHHIRLLLRDVDISSVPLLSRELSSALSEYLVLIHLTYYYSIYVFN